MGEPIVQKLWLSKLLQYRSLRVSWKLQQYGLKLHNIKKYQLLHKPECQQDSYRVILGKVKYLWMHV